VLAAVIAAGCIGQDEVRDEPSATASASAVLATPALEPSLTAAPTSTAAPTEAPTAAPTPTEPEPSAEASPSGEPGSADVCTGNDSNREFYANVAAAFAWPVYCPVLPARWSVISGRYRSDRGGWVGVASKGPGGARCELHEGACCAAADGCVPLGSDAGTAAFGDLSGTLVTADDGRYAVVVDRGAARSWLAIGSGLDVEQFKAFAADLALVE